jgi:ribonuclease VapC
MNVFVDSSALVAILTYEEDADDLADKLEMFDGAMVSAIVIFESTLAVARKRVSEIPEAQGDVTDFLAMANISILDLGDRETNLALDAHARFGKGRHRGSLNMGDCFAYACAKMHRVPLLCKGDDFLHTDIRIA